MQYLHQQNRDDIAVHSTALIRFLSQKIEEEFGFTQQIGFEKEAYFTFKNGLEGIESADAALHLDDYRQLKALDYNVGKLAEKLCESTLPKNRKKICRAINKILGVDAAQIESNDFDEMNRFKDKLLAGVNQKYINEHEQDKIPLFLEELEIETQIPKALSEGNFSSVLNEFGQPATSPIEALMAEVDDNQFEFQTPPSHPVRAVLRADAQSNLVQGFSQKYLDKLSNIGGKEVVSQERLNRTHKKVSEYVNEFGVHHVEYLPFRVSSSDMEVISTSGIHLNLSLWNRAGHNITNDAIDDADELSSKNARSVAKVHDAMINFGVHDIALLAPTEKCFLRLRIRDLPRNIDELIRYKGYDEETESRFGKDKSKFSRLEWRLPSVKARHDLCAVVALSAVYAGLKHPEIDWKSNIPENIFNPHSALMHFQNHSQVITTLREATADNEEMQSHVESLKTGIITAAKHHALAQPDVGHWLAI